ncbi:hypothetical protein F444_21246 [Phytophthora nicotianae P1976]|uniref:Uncharacterized protein n=1 Tax=Phytophthora nicotianae P1976 TaxID=1317066 RepID=A0A080Z1S1_PHYNI|nr:hypothetical protein F444_21246 [Phytophthora nicotianae P1976]
MMTLQNKNRSFAKRDVGVEFPGLGDISGQSLMSMRRWHQAVDALNLIDKAKKWIDELDFLVAVPPAYRVERTEDMSSKLDTIPSFSEEIHILDFVARNQLSDTALMEAMSKLFGPRQDVIVVDPLIWGVVKRANRCAD